MVDSKELRIGNYVKMNNKVVYMDVRLFHAVIHGFEGYTPEYISLTEEWLLKFDFRKMNSPISKTIYVLYIDENAQLEAQQGEKGFFVTLILTDENDQKETMDVACRYFSDVKVHQLQNLYYCLTQQDLN